MKNKTVAILTIASLVLFPCRSEADLDILSIAEDQISAATAKVDTIVKEYTGIQFKLQEMSLNRDIVSELRENVKDGLKARYKEFYGDMKDAGEAEAAMFLKSSLSNVALPGIGDTVDLGAFVTPKTKVAVGEKYLKRRHQRNDVQYTVEQDLRINNLMIDNVSTLFSNSLVRRKQIIDEDPCSCVDEANPDCAGKKEECEAAEKEFSEMNDVNVVKRKYYEVSLNAHHRWLKIQEAQASYVKLQAEQQINATNVDNVSEITGVLEDVPDDTPSDEKIAKLKESKSSSQDVTERMKQSLDNIQKGDYSAFAANVLGGAGDVAASKGKDNWSDFFKNLSEGNTSAAVDNLSDAYNEQQKQQQEAQKAAEEQQKKQEEQLKEAAEKMRQELEKSRQEDCQKCNAENEARQKSGEPMISCVSRCTF